MTQVLPAMQFLREEFRRRQAGDQTIQRDHPGLAEEHVILLLPDTQTLLTNWGTEAAKMPLAFDRLQVTRDLMLGQRCLAEGQFDLAAPLMLAALGRVRAQGWVWLALRERAPIALFCKECLARRLFVEQARQIRDTLLVGLAAEPPPQPRPGGLTLAEYGLLQRLHGPVSNKLLAREMGVTEAAVKFHLKNIYRKLGVHRRSEALSTASARGWIAPAAGHSGR
jgi:DNA-binding CsgD family transcriptional regulator